MYISHVSGKARCPRQRRAAARGNGQAGWLEERASERETSWRERHGAVVRARMLGALGLGETEGASVVVVVVKAKLLDNITSTFAKLCLLSLTRCASLRHCCLIESSQQIAYNKQTPSCRKGLQQAPQTSTPTPTATLNKLAPRSSALYPLCILHCTSHLHTAHSLL